ncbi:MAG: lysozyme inhibitor LprI family protein [Gallionella sp.]|nr:lysozyme inhibitor LprI family protein [Gallionella sp.]
MKRIAWAVLGWAFMVATAQSASFDCAKASTKIEKLICDDAELSKLDKELNTAYKIGLQAEKQAASIRQNQKQWVMERNACSSILCIKDKYKTRITQLSSLNPTGIQSPLEGATDAEACQSVADFWNRGDFKTLLRSAPSPLTIERSEICRIFGLEDSGSIRDAQIWKLDLNVDGIPDYFGTIVDGTGMIVTGYALSGVNGSTVVDTFGTYGSDFYIISTNSKNFILSSNINKPDGLLRLSKGGNMEYVCRFIQRDKPLLELTAGKGNSVCSAVSTGAIDHIDFNSTNKSAFRGIAIAALAKIDLDNDGKTENVAIVNYDRVFGSSCTDSKIRIVSDSNAAIADSNINKIIDDHLGDCDIDQRVFVHGGLTYIDEQSSDESRTILLIKDGKGDAVCRFNGRLLFDVENEGPKH